MLLRTLNILFTQFTTFHRHDMMEALNFYVQYYKRHLLLSFDISSCCWSSYCTVWVMEMFLENVKYHDFCFMVEFMDNQPLLKCGTDRANKIHSYTIGNA
jgi:hypothetical protein